MNNLKQHSPVWLVNLTAALAVLTPVLPSLVQTLPGNVSELTRDWLLWIMSALTAVSAAAAAVSKSRLVGGRPDDRKP